MNEEGVQSAFTICFPLFLQRREGQKGGDGGGGGSKMAACVRRSGPMSSVQQEPGCRCLLSLSWLKAATQDDLEDVC